MRTMLGMSYLKYHVQTDNTSQEKEEKQHAKKCHEG